MPARPQEKTTSNSGDGPPECLKPYMRHGIDFEYKPGNTHAHADCPWCGREGKFRVDIKTGQWICWQCREGGDNGGGNATVFLRMLWDKSFKETGIQEYVDLAQRRRLLQAETLIKWQLCKSCKNGKWLIPGFSPEAKLNSLYQYVTGEDKNYLLPTDTMKHQLFGMNLYDPRKEVVFLCESIWDAIALWEILGISKQIDENKLVQTANPDASLLANSNVISIPSCTAWRPAWLDVVAGKVVHLMCQNDHELVNCVCKRAYSKYQHAKCPRCGSTETVRNVVKPPSYTQMQRIAGLMKAATKPPQEINYLYWSDTGFNPKLPHGFDIRDLLTKGMQNASSS